LLRTTFRRFRHQQAIFSGIGTTTFPAGAIKIRLSPGLVQSAAAALEELKKCLLRQAFNGEF
jgi:hypothetical protein